MTTTGLDTLATSLANRAEALGYWLAEKDNKVHVMSGDIVAFVGSELAIDKLLRDLERTTYGGRQ